MLSLMRGACGVLRRALVVLALCIVGASASEAQQTCLASSESSRSSVQRFLQSPADAIWRETHGITATQVGQLQPLTDADAVLCRRMDSAFVRLPVYYLRAGNYIIASNPLNPAPDPVTGLVRVRDGPTVFVFDSAGSPYYLPGSVTPTGPTGLAALSAINDRIELGWTNQPSDAVNFRLQRSTSGATFVNVGGLLPITATTVIDTSVLAGSIHTYRIASIGSTGDVIYFSNAVTVALTDIGTVVRVATGLLYRDQFNRADGSPGADWVVESGSWAIVNNALQITVGVSQSAIIRASALTARKNFHIQLLNNRSQLMNYAAMYARRSGSTLYMGDLGSTADGVRPGKPRMYRQTAGSYASLGFGTFSAVANTSHRLTFSVLGNSHQLWAEGVLQVSATDATVANDINGNFSLNAYGQNAGGTIRFDDVVVCSARSVSIGGLPNGHKLRIVNLVSPSAMNGGAVSVDVLAAQLPVTQIEILDGANVVVKRYSPTDGVWGGDVYTLNPAQ